MAGVSNDDSARRGAVEELLHLKPRSSDQWEVRLTDVCFGRQVKDNVHVSCGENVFDQLPVAHVPLVRDAFNCILMVERKEDAKKVRMSALLL